MAAGAAAVTALALSSTLVSGAGMPWYDATPGAAATPTTIPTQAPPPATTAAPAPAMSGHAAPVVPRQTRKARRASATPTSPGATPRPDVLLGPGDGRGLRFMLLGYCYTQRGMGEARLRSGADPARNNWECRGDNRRELIDIGSACRWRYGAGTIAKFSDPHNAYTWRCYRR